MARVPLPVRELGELRLLIRSRTPLIALRTVEEDRADVLLEYLAASESLPYFVWSESAGLTRQGEPRAVYGTEKLPDALSHVKASAMPAIHHFKDVGELFTDVAFRRKLREVHAALVGVGGALVVTGIDLDIPADIAPLFADLELLAPTPEEYFEFVQRLLRSARERIPVAMKLDVAGVRELLSELRGLSLMEVRKVLTHAMFADNELGPQDIERVRVAKRAIVERSGVLEYFAAEGGLDAIAGLSRLKAWLESRVPVFRDPERAAEFGLDAPRGLLLVGVQGCGKSLCAKAVSRAWNVPLIRLDPARLYDKYVGETEKNLQLAMNTAERLAPVVLWVDEIEKSLSSAGSENDGGSAQRMLGTFLAWLQEKRSQVFVVATSNDVSKLPPELLRKGRFDEIFFVDLPDATSREAILSLHLAKRKREPARFDLTHLAALSEGFSGAELEQAIVSGLYAAFEENVELSTEHVSKEITSTNPLSKTMAERVGALRVWARGRTVPAD